MTIFYKVCDKETQTIKAIYNNKIEAHKHASTNPNYFVAVGFDF
jgi:hypothetical protein